MTEKNIRAATVSDVPALTQIRNDAVARKMQHGDYAWGKSGWTEAATLQAFERGGVHMIEQHGIPAGMMSLSWQDDKYWGPQNPDAGYVHGIAVRNGFRGLGLGRYAIDWCADHIRVAGRIRLRLDCDVDNTKLCAYYESLGFRRVATRSISAEYVASLYERVLR